MNEDRDGDGLRSAVSRRDVLKYLAMGSAAVAAAPVLAACGGSSGGGGTPSGGGSSSSSSSGGSTASGSVQDITKFVTIDTAHAGKGLTIDMGVVLAFTGPGAFFGRVMSNGCKLAAKHIEALGGPKFNFIFKDHKSGDPQAGVNAVKELGFSKVPVMLASYVDDLGAMLPGQKQYQIFTMDGGGGTSTFAQGAPYFWGMRAVTPNDAAPGAAKYMTETMKLQQVQLLGWDLGALNEGVLKNLRATLKKYNVTEASDFIPVKVGATDYSAAIQKLKSAKPKMVWASIYGNDPGYFMKQYTASGINAPVTIFEFTADAAKVAGSAYDGVYFAYDFFNPKKPDNGWSQIFIDEYNKEYNTDPDFYAANYYEDTFAMWDVLQRVLAAGGDPKKGVDWDKQMQAKPQFVSVYGGDQNTAGEIVLSTTTHSVTRRPMSISQYKGGNITPLAYYNIDAADYKLA